MLGNIGVLMVSLVVVGIAAGALLAFPIMWMWDYVMPSVFGLPEITWLQSWALYVFCNLLFRTNVTVNK